MRSCREMTSIKAAALVVVFSSAGTKPQCLHHRADPWRVHLAGEKEVQALPGVSQGAAEVQSLCAHPYPYPEVSVQPCGRSGLWGDVIFFFSFNNVLVWLHRSHLLCCKKERAEELSLYKYLAAIIKIFNLCVFSSCNLSGSSISLLTQKARWVPGHQLLSWILEKGYANAGGNCWCHVAFCWQGLDVGGVGVSGMGGRPCLGWPWCSRWLEA